MDTINIKRIAKRYAAISIGLILLAIFVLFISNNSFYAIRSSKSFTVKAIELEGDKNISKLFSIYIVPRNTSSLRIESSNGTNIPGDEIIKPLTAADTKLGFHKLDLEFTPQYDISTSSRENEGCVYGKYPNVVSYRCSDPSRVVAYDAQNPLDNGKVVYLPPTPIGAITSNIVATPDRTLGAGAYKDGLLTLNARQTSQHDLPLLGEMSLKYIDNKGNISDIQLKGSYEEFENGRYQLITDSSGSSNFAIIDNMTFELHTYRSTDDEPRIISLGTEPDASLSNICDLNSGKLACYSGVATTHVHEDEEQDHIESLEVGSLTVYSFDSGTKELSSKVPKENPPTNLCLDKSGKLYTLGNDSIDLISVEGENIVYYPVAYRATSISCGNNVHFALDNKIYTIKEDGLAHLIYDSKLLPMASVSSQGDSIFMVGYYESLPQGRFNFSIVKPESPHTKQRVSDIVASIVDKHKNDLSFEARFTPKSIDYIVAKKFSPSGAIEDKDSIKSLQESTDIFKLDFKPTFHSAPNY